MLLSHNELHPPQQVSHKWEMLIEMLCVQTADPTRVLQQ